MSRFSEDHPAGGFRLDSPVKLPVASETPRCAPPHTFGGGEEPWEGDGRRIRLMAAASRHAALPPAEERTRRLHPECMLGRQVA